MKDVIKSIGLFVIGLVIALLGYPILHEFGHVTGAFVVGARIKEINILPLPSVMCEIGNLDYYSVVAIGLGGMIMPFLISITINVRLFWIWYANYIVKLISLLAFAISAVSSICFMLGNPLLNDDITQILIVWPEGESICFLLSLVLASITAGILILENPIERCIRYFEK